MAGWIIRILIGLVILIAVEIYFLKRTAGISGLLFPKLNCKNIKIVKAVFLILLNLYPAFLIATVIIGLILTHRISPPATSLFDYLLIYPFWITFLFMLQTTIYFLVIDILKFTVQLFIRNKKEKIHSFALKLMLAVMIFFAVYVPIRIVYDYRNVSVRIVEYKKDDLPEALNNFKIALIADIQADKYTDDKRLQNYVDKVNSTNPDLVLIAGDLITSTPDFIDKSASYVGKIKSKYGVYSCVGDHDNWAYREDNPRSIKEITAALAKHGIEMINNSKRKIEVDSSEICITFIRNTYVETISSKLLDSLTYNDNHCDLKIFLTHQPRNYLIDKAIEKNYDLFFAGHTHGGQITLMFPFVYITPTMFETSFIRGDFHFGNLLMIVNRGLGMSLAPIRYNSTPEVTVIVLKTKP